ncbi:MAG: TIGR00269 family protein [Candidatus Thermoplasmatota archaeon]|nr:TIGR00269 family protein [Candidatus Thermoplasmatota archaeon]
MTCSVCGKPAITFIRYSGRHLCYDHLADFVVKRARKAFREQYKIPRGGKVAVAISGGKDSAAALFLTKEIFAEHEDKEIFAVTVDEGIAGYRPDAVKKAREQCELVGVPHVVVSFEELYGKSLDHILSGKRVLGACSYCGVLRRQAMNLAARQEDASALVTGLNLDDTAQAILMNIARGDVERLARMGPHVTLQPGLVPRLSPLRTVPEKESYLFCLARNIPFHDGQCPYAVEAQRGLYRDVLNRLEDNTPGTRHSILKTYDAIKPLLETSFETGKLSSCPDCGEPTIGEKCRACIMLEELKN